MNPTNEMSAWPTSLESDGTAPTLIQLLTSRDAFVVRQAAYLAAVAAALQDSGTELEVVQQHVVSNGVGLTIPLIVKGANKQRIAVYTNSEPWTTESVVRLMYWIRDLAGAMESMMPVVVIAQHDSDKIEGLAGVAQFICVPDADGARITLLL